MNVRMFFLGLLVRCLHIVTMLPLVDFNLTLSRIINDECNVTWRTTVLPILASHETKGEPPMMTSKAQRWIDVRQTSSNGSKYYKDKMIIVLFWL